MILNFLLRTALFSLSLYTLAPSVVPCKTLPNTPRILSQSTLPCIGKASPSRRFSYSSSPLSPSQVSQGDPQRYPCPSFCSTHLVGPRLHCPRSYNGRPPLVLRYLHRPHLPRGSCALDSDPCRLRGLPMGRLVSLVSTLPYTF